MKIAPKISLSFLITALLLTGITVPIFYWTAKDSLQKAIFAHLRTTAKSRAEHVKTSLEDQKHEAELIAESYWLENAMETINNNHAGSPELIEKIMSELKEYAHPEQGLYEVFVLNLDGKIIASSDRSKIGLNRSTDAYFLEGKKKTYIKDAYYSETTKQNSICVSTPIRTDETGNLLGVLVVRYNLKQLYKITTDTTGLGQTGEIYLVNKDGFIITPSRFRKDTFLKQMIGTKDKVTFTSTTKKWSL